MARGQQQDRPRSPRRLTYGPFRAVLLVAILVIPSCFEPMLRDEAQRLIRKRQHSIAFAAPGVPNKLPAQSPRYQAAPPAASGAHPPYPLNHTFDAEPIELGSQPNADFETDPATTGTPPTNYDLTTASTDAGTPPTDFNFAAGDFSNWITTGSPALQTNGGPDGTFAQLDVTTNESLTSSAFTVANDAQGLTFDLGYLTASGTAMQIAAQFVGKTLYGSGLLLIRFLKLFNESAKLFRVCTKPGALGYACKHFDEFFPRLTNLLNNSCVRAFLYEVSASLSNDLTGAEFTAEQGAMWLQSAAFACLTMKVRTPNGQPGMILAGRPAENTSTFGSGVLTSGLGLRNAREFWRRWMERHPEALSPENRRRILDDRLSPRVDEAWAKVFPEDGQYMGDVLEHHHFDCGFWAIPIARGDHRGNSQRWHQNCP